MSLIKVVLKKIILNIKYRDSIIKSFNISKDIECGSNCNISRRVQIGENVKIGDYTYLNSNKNWIIIESNVTIGKYCSVAPGVNIGLGNHDYTNVTTHPILFDKYYKNKLGLNNNVHEYNGLKDKDMITLIGNDVWIGMNANIKRGIKIGNGAVIASNSVVTHDVPDYSIVGGNPAKVIRYRFEQEEIECMKKNEDRAWWTWNIDFLKDNINNLYDIKDYLVVLKSKL